MKMFIPNIITGNTIFLALGISSLPATPEYLWAKALITISAFLLGVAFFMWGARLLSPTRRSTLIIFFTVQTIAIYFSAIIVEIDLVKPKSEDPHAPIQWMQALPLSFLAFQAAGQVIASRILGFADMPTILITGAMTDLIIDPKLFQPGRGWRNNHVKRNRKASMVFALFLGSAVSGALMRNVGLASSLWLAASLKASVTASWFVWKGKAKDVEMGQK